MSICRLQQSHGSGSLMLLYLASLEPRSNLSKLRRPLPFGTRVKLPLRGHILIGHLLSSAASNQNPDGSSSKNFLNLYKAASPQLGNYYPFSYRQPLTKGSSGRCSVSVPHKETNFEVYLGAFILTSAVQIYDFYVFVLIFSSLPAC